MKTVTLDCETTGLAPAKADYKIQYMDYPYIVTFAYKINGEPVKEFIINQEGREVPAEATAIHGVTNEMCAASPFTLPVVLCEFIFAAKGAEFSIGHNIYFDSSTIKANVLRMIKQETAKEAFYKEIEGILHKDRRIDTMMSTIKFCALPGKYAGQFKWPRLTELHEKLFPGETFDAHSSGADVDATYKCYLKLKELGVI